MFPKSHEVLHLIFRRAFVVFDDIFCLFLFIYAWRFHLELLSIIIPAGTICLYNGHKHLFNLTRSYGVSTNHYLLDFELTLFKDKVSFEKYDHNLLGVLKESQILHLFFRRFLVFLEEWTLYVTLVWCYSYERILSYIFFPFAVLFIYNSYKHLWELRKAYGISKCTSVIDLDILSIFDGLN